MEQALYEKAVRIISGSITENPCRLLRKFIELMDKDIWRNPEDLEAIDSVNKLKKLCTKKI